MVASAEINGKCDSRFRAVQEAFAENFASWGEVGASVAICIEGRTVVDLWGGHMDAARTRPWEQDTIVNVYSTTKGMTSLCAHMLVDQGKLDLDAPVARYWPEFAQAGKGDITVRQLMSHRAGLPAVKASLPPGAFFEWETMTQALAAQEPWWEPGTRQGYHAFTFGWLVGELVRRISGKSVGTFFRDEVGDPLGVDFHIGLDARHDSRTASMIAPPFPAPGEPNPMLELMNDPESIQAKALANPPWMPGLTENTRQWRAAEIPAANGHTNARALARVYEALSQGGVLDGVRLLRPETIEQAITEQSDEHDAIIGVPMRFAVGFALNNETFRQGPNPRGFGHAGYGGSIGCADPDARVGFGYAMNQIRPEIGSDPRVISLVDAAYGCL